MIDKRILFKQVAQSEFFPVLVQLYEELINKWNAESPVRDNEYETLKALFINEGKIQGVREYFKNLENQN